MNHGLNRQTKIEAERRRQEAVSILDSLQAAGIPNLLVEKRLKIAHASIHYWKTKEDCPSKKRLKKLKLLFKKIYLERQRKIKRIKRQLEKKRNERKLGRKAK